jgi:hypothetical protein
MSSDDPILDETNFSSFLEAIKKEYDSILPTDFSNDSPVSKLLNSSSPIKVMQGTEENTLYEARGSPLYSPPFTIGNPQLTTIIILTVKVPN